MHSLGVSHTWKLAQIHIHMLSEYRANHLLREGHNILLIDKRSLDIYLRKLRLAIRAEVFVTKTLGNLIIAVTTGYHQHLFEQLRRLGHGKKLSRIGARWDEIIPRAFWRCSRHNRRFNIQKAMLR